MLTLSTHDVRAVLNLSKGGIFNRLEPLTPVATGRKRLGIYATSDVLTRLDTSALRRRAPDIVAASTVFGDGLWAGEGAAERGRALVRWLAKDESQMARLWQVQRDLANGLAQSMTSGEMLAFLPGLNFKIATAAATLPFIVCNLKTNYPDRWALYAFALVNAGGEIEQEQLIEDVAA